MMKELLYISTSKLSHTQKGPFNIAPTATAHTVKKETHPRAGYC